jgi:2,4-dienoyl-CoA reductase-like NADH-dependent reductase (Old Yellow Enzyme family)
MNSYTHIDKPLRIGKSLEIKNRVVRPAHGTSFGLADGGLMNDRLIAYHEARARGGVGLSIVEILAVHRSSPGALRIYTPGQEAGYRKLIETIRPTGMKLFQQLYHSGHCNVPLDGSAPWSSSDVPNPKINVVPEPMTQGMIDAVVEAYANTARQMEAWGLDGVDVHCAHGYLIHQFLSPASNRREDDYGGPLENRMRFMMQILAAIRASVSEDFVVGVRVAPDAVVGGCGPADLIKVVATAEERKLIDYVNISMGSYHAYAKMIGGMHEPMGYELETSVPISRTTTTPTLVVGRFRTLEEADAVIRAGDADMVGMVRATIADPELVNKSFAGNADKVRPCIACNQACAARPTGVVACAVNPSAGFEASVAEGDLSPAEVGKTVLVVGGGPAGLEAARTAALRGHSVILAEAQPHLGGALRMAAQAPTRHGIGDIIEWLEARVFELGVDVRLSTYLDADDVAEIGADVVILATGSMPRMDGVQISNPGEPIAGFERRNVLSSVDLFGGAPLGDYRKAVVIDDLGHYEAIGTAEHLIASGLAVDFVTRFPAFAPVSDMAHMVEPALARLNRGKFTVYPRSRAIEIDDDGVVIGPTYEYLRPSANMLERLPADVVVFVSANSANRMLYDDLRAMGIETTLIGDANRPRFLESATRDGRLAGLAC